MTRSRRTSGDLHPDQATNPDGIFIGGLVDENSAS